MIIYKNNEQSQPTQLVAFKVTGGPEMRNKRESPLPSTDSHGPKFASLYATKASVCEGAGNTTAHSVGTLFEAIGTSHISIH